ncbi:MAG: alanine racemase [Anaeroplasma sp.]|nr:alanine racemase [Anaeroplasma sp.]
MKLYDISQIKKNLNHLKKRNLECLVIKDDAYGFGLKKIINISEELKIKAFAVISLAEGINARKYTDSKIMILSPMVHNVILLKKYELIPSCQSVEDILFCKNNKIKYAIEINIGMNRFGLNSIDLIDWNDEFLDSIYAHFPSMSSKINALAYRLYNECIKHNKSCHFGGSRIVDNLKLPLRIGYYAYLNSTVLLGKIIMLRSVDEYEEIGYDLGYVTYKKEIIAIINLGYANGINPNFNGFVGYKNKKYRVIGKVCMNQLFVLADDSFIIDQYVEFFGRNIEKNEFLKNNYMTDYQSFLSIK